MPIHYLDQRGFSDFAIDQAANFTDHQRQQVQYGNRPGSRAETRSAMALPAL